MTAGEPVEGWRVSLLEGATGQPPTKVGTAGPVRFAGPDLSGSSPSRAWVDGPRQPDPSSGPLPLADTFVDRDAGPDDRDTRLFDRIAGSSKRDVRPVDRDAGPVYRDASPFARDARAVDRDVSPVDRDVTPVARDPSTVDLADFDHRNRPADVDGPAADVPDLAQARAGLLQAGPDVDDVLDLVVRLAAGLLDAPARLAEPVEGHLIWTRAFGDDDADLGAHVDTEDTLSGTAWRSGLVQFNGPSLSTRCCGSPHSALAVPIAHAREAVGGRHSSSGHEVFALIVLTADRPGWFDRADVRSMRAIAAAAADRIAQLHAESAVEDDPRQPGDGFGRPGRSVLTGAGAAPGFGDVDGLAHADEPSGLDELGGPSGSDDLEPGDAGAARSWDELETVDDAEQSDRGPDGGTGHATDPADRFSPISVPQFDASLFTPRPALGAGAGPGMPHAAGVDQPGLASDRWPGEDEPGGTAAAPGLYDFHAAQQTLSEKLLAAGASGSGGWFEEYEEPADVSAMSDVPAMSGVLEVSGVPGFRDVVEPMDEDGDLVEPQDEAGTGDDGEPLVQAEGLAQARALAGEEALADAQTGFAGTSPQGLTLDDAFFDDSDQETGPNAAAADQQAAGWDQSPITPRTPMVIASILDPSAAKALRSSNTPLPRLLPTTAVRPPTPGLQAPVAPALFQRSESVLEPAPRRPRTRTVKIAAPAPVLGPQVSWPQPSETQVVASDPQAVAAPHVPSAERHVPPAGPRTFDVPEPRSPEPNASEAISPRPNPAEPTLWEPDPSEPNSAATVLTAGSLFAPVPSAGPDTGSDPQTATFPAAAQPAATQAVPARFDVTRIGSVTTRSAPVQQPPVVHSRKRQPGMQPASTLPPAMPAPESMGLWQWDAVTGECVWSSPVAKLLGLAADTPLDLELLRDAVTPADQERFDLAVQTVTSGRGVAGAIRLNGLDGPDGAAREPRTAYAWSEVRRDDNGVLLGAWGGVVDVTAFEHDAAQLRSGLTAQRAAQELAGLATWQWHPASRELVWSPEMYRLLGLDPGAFTATLEGWQAFVHPDDIGQARMLDLGALADPAAGAERVETFRLIGSGGEIRHVQSWSAVSEDGSATPTVYGATIDVTRQVQDRVMLEHLSITDPVTGLGNRLAYDRRISQLLAQPNQAVTLMLLDLDRFKVVNDSLGHQVGDRLLIEVARRLVALVPEDSVTARMGGDEFVVVPPPGANEDDVRRLAVGIVDALRAPYVLPETGELLVCPASIGIAMSARRRVTGHDLLREADIALYQAKDGGRDRYVIFDEPLRQRTHVRARAERHLREALQDGRLVMEYQPVIDFTDGRLAGAEGLVRLHDSDDDGGRLISPDLFMDIAEQTGLIVEVDCWVIEAAISQLAQWGEHSEHAVTEGDPGELPWLAINLSARSMEHPRVVRRLIEAVKRGEVQRGRLKIELTEHSFIGALPGVEAALRQLVANGIQIGIDDFGTGYSALAYLANFDLDFMKIDRSFVVSVGDNPRGDAVVTAIVDLAHAHGMKVIAEGVETSRQARRLREIGCDFAQGYHFGRPGSPSRITPG